jgi:predicted Zn-dependent protease
MVTEYVARLGQNLVRNSDPKFSFAIKVIDSDEIKAFALPGGILYVNSGSLLAADNEAELAAVMSHAIAHVNARHVTRIFTQTASLSSPRKPEIQQKLIVPDYCSIYAMCEKDELNASPVFFRFARGFEMEADWLGVQYIYKAGYDPNGFLSFLEKREQIEKKAPLAAAKFPTHPTNAERIAVIEKEIASVLPARERYVLDTLEFEQVKARIASLKTQQPSDVTQR